MFAVFVAALFLSTAIFHVLSHADLSESSCAVCHAQRDGLTGASSPSIVTVPVPEVLMAAAPCALLISKSAAVAAARAPPVVPA
ncbi:MAG: hypothetical protein A2506_02140 [Elusimicrobia bacterium RIFOXYD12_FULL_66_9]|nr:MAG: hypothetical protein A2506_02140 [Elusimicrobia bacterium RIFOXYD12_FULL_66_9]